MLKITQQDKLFRKLVKPCFLIGREVTLLLAFPKWFLVILFILLVPAICVAENIYVAQNSSGGNSGADCSNAHSSTWFNNASNWGAGKDKISAGDTVHLCGTFTGTNGQTMLTVQGSGTSGNPIIILFEDGAKLTAEYWGTVAALNITGPDYITVDGGTNGLIEATNNGTDRTYQEESYGIELSSWSTNIIIKNLTIADMYVRIAGIPNPTGGTSACIKGQAGDNIEIYNMTCFNVSTSFSLHYPAGTTTNNWKFHDNHVYNFADGFYTNCGGENGVLEGLEIYNNRLHDVSFWGNPPPDHPHTDGFQIAAVANGCRIDNLKIYNNKVSGTGWTYSDGQRTSTGAIFIEGRANYGPNMGMPGALIYNNLLAIDCTPQAQSYGNGYITVVNANTSSQPGLKIYNNTIVGCRPRGSGGLGIMISGVTQNADIRNNLIADVDTCIYASGSNATFQIVDYNQCGSSVDTSAPYYYQTGYKSYAGWQALGFGANDIYNQNPELDGE